jgi:hypothetical protein
MMPVVVINRALSRQGTSRLSHPPSWHAIGEEFLFVVVSRRILPRSRAHNRKYSRPYIGSHCKYTYYTPFEKRLGRT